MNYKAVSTGLGLFSIALGLAEMLAPRQIAQALEADGKEGVVRGFGVREMMAGAGILAAPAASATIWSRVAGDAMDLGALGLAARSSPRNGLVWAAIGFVAAVTALDIVTARGLDRETGRLLPARAG